MDRYLFSSTNLSVLERSGRFFIQYDAGAHFEVLREDEVSEDEAREAATNLDRAEKVILALQKRLINQGSDPYKSNVKDR